MSSIKACEALLAGALAVLVIAGAGPGVAGEAASSDEYATDDTPPEPFIKPVKADRARIDAERTGEKPIYGADDRDDWWEINDQAVKDRARASVALFPRTKFRALPSGKLKLKSQSLGEQASLCQGERFANQVAASNCSGTLVAEDLVLTAGHCVAEIAGEGDKATDTRFVFGYWTTSASDPGRTEFDRSHVFTGKEVVSGKLVGPEEGQEDWALIRLKTKVPPEIAKPVTKIAKAPVKTGAKIYVIGYPSGLPLKYSPGAEVRDVSQPAFFKTNLDTFGGNSGSGVYAKGTNELIGILVRGDTDYYQDEEKGCVRAYQCSKTGCGGEDVTKVEVTGLK